MSDLFLKILSMSLSALWLVPVVLLLRLALKRSPKWIHVLLWAMVAVRLVCPFSFESSLSLIPESVSSGAVLEEWSDDYLTNTEAIFESSPDYQAAVDAGRTPIPAGDGGYYVITAPDGISPPETVETEVLPKLALLWVAGMAAMALYTATSYLSLRRKVASAVRLKHNIFQSEAVGSPFVLGLIRPKIYLPFSLSEKDLSHVVAHERAHICRKDHWWKPLGFLVLTVHWFNPVVWLSYCLLCRDIELACDEKVIMDMNLQQQADYSQALLNCSVHRRSIAACPLAFGEVGVKKRVSNILNYRKPAFWIVLIALVLCIVVAVCFLTNPVERDKAPFGLDWYLDSYLYINSDYPREQFPDDPRKSLLPFSYRLSEDGELSVMEAPDTGKWATLGVLEEAHLSMLNFDEYFKSEDTWYTNLYRPEKFRETYKSAWRLEVNPTGTGLFYLLLEMEDGGLYLMCGHDQGSSYPAEEPDSTMYFVARLSEVTPETGTVTRWFDYLESGEYPSGEENYQAQLPQYPDVTFQAQPGGVYAHTDTTTTLLFSGMPVWNVYLCDLTGDGIPELCATVSMGSGIIDEHVVVYDYATGTEYTLWDRGVFDYTLRLDGWTLICDRWFYPHNGLSASGQLMLVSAGGGDGMRLEINFGDEKEEEPTSVSFEDFDFSSVTDIMLTNAHNGKSTAISEPDAVEAICAFLSTVSGTNGRNSKGLHCQGSYALTLLAGEEQVLQITFGDDDVFFHGMYDEHYAMMYDMEGHTAEGIIHYFYHFDETGFDWGFEETMVSGTAEDTPYSITSSIPQDGLRADIEYLTPGDVTGYGFLKEERFELAVLLNNLMPEAFEAPVDYTPTMKVNLRWDGGRMTLYSDGVQTVFGEDGEWAVRTQDLNNFFARFNPGRLMGEETVPLEDMNPNYNSEQAMIDGCVVFRNSDIRDNGNVFTAFAESVNAGAPASVRTAWFSDEERFAIGVTDVIFDGEGFTRRTVSNGEISEKWYQYLRHFTGEPTEPNATYDAYDAYILTNDRTATWEQLWNSLYSSQMGVAIDFSIVYMDYIYYPNHPSIPDCESITMEYEGELLLNADNVDALEALFSQAEETYEPKTWSPGPILRFSGKDGSELIIELGLDTDWVRIDGTYYDFGPGYDADGSLNALPQLFDLLGIEDWPQEVKAAYPDYF